MKIWKTVPTLEQLNAVNPGTIHSSLGIEFIAMGDDFLEARMPVDHRTIQTRGLLHGGASVVLAESLGSLASVLVAGPSPDALCVGIEINASHLKSMRSGSVIGRVTPIRLGKSIHVWDIQIRDASNPEALVCRSRLTVVVKK